MLTVDQVLEAIDRMSPTEVEKVYQRAAQRRQASYFILSDESVKKIEEAMQPVYDEIAAKGITEEETNALIDEALAEVRREQQTNRRS